MIEYSYLFLTMKYHNFFKFSVIEKLNGYSLPRADSTKATFTL